MKSLKDDSKFFFIAITVKTINLLVFSNKNQIKYGFNEQKTW